MALIGANGGLIGTQRSANTSTAPGLWTPYEQVLLRRAGLWPLSGDPFFAYNSLSLHMDGSNGSTTFTDSSSNALTVTANGNAQISTAQSKFGGASGLFDGTGDFLRTPSNAVVAVGTNDFTAEAWVHRTSGGTFAMVVGTRLDTGNYADAWGLGVDPSNNLFVYSSAFIAQSTGGLITLNTWHHIAVVRSGTAVRMYHNGTQVATGTNSQNFSRQILAVGANVSGDQAFAGYIDDLRVTKGVARYTANFTPTSGPFLDVGTGGYPYFPTTNLLLHMDGTNGSTTFTDTGSSTLTVTPFGNAQISTAQSKFGGASALFDGAGDYLQTSSTSLFDLPGDFTIELWVRPAANVTNAGLIIRRVLDTSGTGTWGLQINNGTATFSNLQTLANTTFGTVPLNAWTHIAVSRNGSSILLFLNGSLNAIATDSTSFISVRDLYVGTWGAIGGGVPNTGFFNGYIDDLRITKGVALYTGGFTLPTAAFPDVGTGGDPYFPTTNLLLHMDGTNGSTTFTDNSSNTLTVTANGNAQISTAQSKFGGASGLFDGSGDYLTVTDPDTKLIPALGDFTAECWVYVTTARIYQSIWRTATGDTFRIFLWNADNDIMMRINTTQYFEGTNNTSIGGSGFSSNAWHHIAVCRVSGVFTLYLNGVSHIVVNNQTGYNLASPINRLGASSTGAELFAGYIDEARFTKGVARYTANFTPPTSAFPEAGTGEGDNAFAYNSLLLHMDGTNGSTTFTDSSSNALALTVNGNAQISTAQSKFGGASGLFDGSVDNLTVSNAVLNIASSENYTWEGWFYATSTGGYKCIINNDFGFSATPRLYLKDSNLLGYIDSNDRISHQTTVTTNAWHHFAMVRESNITCVYLNGVQSSASYTYSSASSNDMRIGSDSGGNGQDFAGYLDDIRITKGIARYTASFTPPTAPFPDA